MLVALPCSELPSGLIINSLDICSKNINWRDLERIDSATRNALKKEKEVKGKFTKNGRFRPDKCIMEMNQIKEEWWNEINHLFRNKP